MSFEERLRQVYDHVLEGFSKLIDEIRENLRVRPKYVEPGEEYYEAMKEEQLPYTDSAAALSRLSLKIKAASVIDYTIQANRELNTIYSDLKNVEAQLMDYIDKASGLVKETVDKLWGLDLEFNRKLREVYRDWSDLEERRKVFEELVDSQTRGLEEDGGEKISLLETLEGKVGYTLEELNEYIEKVKAETRDHRKILFRYINFAEGVRTKGVKLYLPVSRIVVRDSHGRPLEVFRFYHGNLKLYDSMIETAKKELNGVSDEFLDALRKYVRVNYGGLRRFFLLMVLGRLRR